VQTTLIAVEREGTNRITKEDAEHALTNMHEVSSPSKLKASKMMVNEGITSR
jgi:hypothetical protein